MRNVPVLLLALLLLASVGRAGHTYCHNEAAPGDVPGTIDPVGVVGVDTGLTGADNRIVCVGLVGVGIDEDVTGLGATVRVFTCAGTVCTPFLEATGAYLVPATTGGPVCVNAVCPKVTLVVLFDGAPFP